MSNLIRRYALEQIIIEGKNDNLSNNEIKSQVLTLIKEENNMDDTQKISFMQKAKSVVMNRVMDNLSKSEKMADVLEKNGKNVEKLKRYNIELRQALKEYKDPSKDITARMFLLALYRLVLKTYRTLVLIMFLIFGSITAFLTIAGISAGSMTLLTPLFIVYLASILALVQICYTVGARYLEGRISKKVALEAVARKRKEFLNRERAIKNRMAVQNNINK